MEGDYNFTTGGDGQSISESWGEKKDEEGKVVGKHLIKHVITCLRCQGGGDAGTQMASFTLSEKEAKEGKGRCDKANCSRELREGHKMWKCPIPTCAYTMCDTSCAVVHISYSLCMKKEEGRAADGITSPKYSQQHLSARGGKHPN